MKTSNKNCEKGWKWVKPSENPKKCHIPHVEEASKIMLGATMMPLVWVSSTARRRNSCIVPALRAHCAKGAPKYNPSTLSFFFFQST